MNLNLVSSVSSSWQSIPRMEKKNDILLACTHVWLFFQVSWLCTESNSSSTLAVTKTHGNICNIQVNVFFCLITSVNMCIQTFAAICVDLLPPHAECQYKWSPDTTAELAGGVRKGTRLHALFNEDADNRPGPAGGRPDVPSASPVR